MEALDGELTSATGPRTRGKQTAPKSKRQERALAVRSSQLKDAGRMLPACPMTADELATQWNVGADDAETITVKVLRVILGTREMEFIASVPLVDWSGERIAAKFGPGTYFIRPASGPYERHSSKIPISEAMAREAGWGRINRPSVAEAAAAQTILQAGEGPTDPKALVMAVSQMMDAKLEDFKRSIGQSPQNGLILPQNPMDMAVAQMEQTEKIMQMMERLEKRAEETVARRMGMVKEDAAVPDTNASILVALLPKALEIFGNMMSGRNQTPPVQQIHQVNPVHQVAQPGGPAVMQAALAQEAPSMPLLSQEEQEAIGGAVAMLRPFAGQLVSMAASSLPDTGIVDELEGFIPGAMVPGLQNLAVVVAKYGPSVLSAIHPALASDRWASILPQLVARCSE
jgi:hypothetical protein